VNKHVQTTKAEKAHLIQVTLSVPNNSKSTAYQASAAVPYLRPKLLAATFVVVRIVTSLVSTSDWFLVNLVIMSRACLGTSIGTWTNKNDLLQHLCTQKLDLTPDTWKLIGT